MSDANTPLAAVGDAVRAGWLMAELRGRLRPGGPSPEIPHLDRADHVLPLPSERTPTEQVIETRRALAALATALGVSVPPPSSGASSFLDQLEDACKALDGARGASDDAATLRAWNDVAELMYQWDAAFQDAVAGQSIDNARAYELGRALAEMYWGLDPGVRAADATGKSAPSSWEFLFGAERVGVIDERLRSLAPHYRSATAPAVSATIHAWASLVADGQLRARPDRSVVQTSLATQVGYWHELVVVGVDPETLLKPYAGLRFTRITPKIARSFAAELIIGTVGLAGLVALALLVVKVQGAAGWKTVAAVAGVLGVTIGGIQAALKNATQSLLMRLRADLYTDLITDAVTSLPPLTWKGKRASHEAKRARTVTSPLPPRSTP
jgi:hypothetical protein